MSDPRIEQLMGRRHINVIPFDQPVELGYRCPICPTDTDPDEDDEDDERLHWSEFNGFLWCDICDQDYPSALCVPLDAEPDLDRSWVNAGPDAAIRLFLDAIEHAIAHSKEPTDA